MLKATAFLAILFCCSITSATENLFEEPSATARSASLPAKSKRERLVSIKPSGGWIAGKALQSKVALNLFEDIVLTGILEKVTRPGPGRSVFKGHLQDQPGGYFIFACSSNVMSGTVFVPGKGTFEIGYAGKGLHRITEIDASATPPCKVVPIGNSTPAVLPDLRIPDSTKQAVANSTTHIVDLLVVYTPQSGSYEGYHQIGTLIDLAVADVNAAFENSKVNVQLRLVHQAKVGYSESGDIAKDLGRLVSPTDGYLDEVISLRNTYKADLVCLLVSDNDGPAGVAPATLSAAHGFSVVSTSYAVTGHVLAHEIAHNFGCQHNRSNAASPGIYPFSYGHVFDVVGWRYGTIMSYVGDRIPYFSNPSVKFRNVPTGIPAGKPGAANNAAALRMRAPVVAAYRSPTNSTLAPSVTITSPMAGFVFRSNSNVIITAAANDLDGTVARVDFLKDGELMGSVTAPPFAFHWTNAPLGWIGSWRARAVDNHEVTTTSAPIQVQIAPSNDQFENRLVLEGTNSEMTIDTTGATGQPGEPSHGDATVWFEWTAPTNGFFRTMIYVGWGWEFNSSAIRIYTGNTVSNLVEAPRTPGNSSEIQAVAGTTYKIAISGSLLGQSLGYFLFQHYPAVTNDNSQNAMTLNGTSLPITANNVGSMNEPGEPGYGHSVWWKWTAPADGLLEITAEGQISPVISVYSNLTYTNSMLVLGQPVSSYNYYYGSRLNVKGGTTYFIVVDSEETGAFTFNLLHSPQPSNDDFANRTTLTGNELTFTISNKGSSRETGEPVIGHGKTVWWTWTAPADGRLEISADYWDVSGGIFTGTNVDQLSTILLSSRPGSSMSISVTEGVSYQIVFDSVDAGPEWGDFNGIPWQFTLEASLVFNPRPANDDFANRQEINSVPARVAGTNRLATQEPGETLHDNAAGETVWYTWTPEVSGLATFVLKSPSYSHYVSIQTGSEITNLVLIPENYSASQRVWPVTAGVPVQIAVDSHEGWGGDAFELFIDLLPTPSNDMFTNRFELSGTNISLVITNAGATMETNEPSRVNDYTSIESTLWWSWTAPHDGVCTITLDSSASSLFIYPAIGIYTGDTPEELATTTNGYDRVRFEVTAGTTYQIQVGSLHDSSGSFSFDLNLRTAAANDFFANREVLTGWEGSVQSDTYGASAEIGEPTSLYDAPVTRSLWWTWTAPDNGRMKIDMHTYGQWFMAVYTGNELGDLTLVTENLWSPFTLTFKVVRDQTYHIRVDGENGPFNFSYELLSTPANDDFEDRITLVGETAEGTATNTFASRQLDEPYHAELYTSRSVWWSWTAPGNRRVRLEAGPEAIVAVYTGEALSTLSAVTSSYDTTLEFLAVEGVTYQIAVDTTGEEAAAGSISLTSEAMPLLANDLFANRFALSGLHDFMTGFNGTATNEANEPIVGLGRTLWWSWTAPYGGRLHVTSPLAQVFQGNSLSNLSRIATVQGAAIINVVSGTTYQISLDSSETYPYVSGSLDLIRAPGNDAFANAYSLSGQDIQTIGSNEGATTESTEPAIAHSGSASIWYKWTAPVAGNTVFEVFGRHSDYYDFPVCMDIYTGSTLSNLKLLKSATNFGQFTASAGIKYFIRLDAPGGEFGDLSLKMNQRPSNDSFARRKALTGYVFETKGSNRRATREPKEPIHGAYNGSASVWYSWRAPITGRVFMQCEEDNFEFSPALAIYRGENVAALTYVAGTLGSGVTAFNAVAGTTYQIAVDGSYSGTGRFTLRLWMNTGAINDNFSRRIGIRGTVATLVGRNAAATKEAKEPNHGGDPGGKSLWWSYQANQTGALILDFSGCSFTPTFDAYIGTNMATLTRTKCFVNYNTSRAVINLVAGTTYQIAVDGYRGASGNVRIQLYFATPPPNDLFEKRSVIRELPFVDSANNITATRQTGEPIHGISGAHSRWWSWKATVTQTVTISVVGDNIRPFAAVYTNSYLTGLKLIAGNVSSGLWNDRITFQAEAGVEYQIAVDSIPNEFGGISFRMESFQKSQNDNIADATPLTGSPISVNGSNWGATAEPGEPPHAGSPARRSVWWKWTAETTGTFPISAQNTDFDSLLSIYTLGPDSQLVLIDEQDDTYYEDDAVITINAVAGTTYWIAVDGFNGAEGEIYLQIGEPEYEEHRTSGGPALRLKGTKDEMFVLQSSTNLVDWENVSTNRFTGSDITIPLNRPASPAMFYRAIPLKTKISN